MKLTNSHIYHIYNQGNNKELIFQSREDYLVFLKKIRYLVKPLCEILAYSLMPNHFHFLIMATDISVETLTLGNIQTNRLSNAFRLLQSEYAQEYNKKYSRSGSLFRQKVKCVDLNERDGADAILDCFNYIHLNPATAGLVEFAKGWEFSSLRDYVLLRSGALCNQQLSFELMGIDLDYMKEMTLER